jgi:hypothetical protein
VDNIKRDLREIGWDGVDLIDLAQDRDQWRALVNNTVMVRTGSIVYDCRFPASYKIDLFQCKGLS